MPHPTAAADTFQELIQIETVNAKASSSRRIYKYNSSAHPK